MKSTDLGKITTGLVVSSICRDVTGPAIVSFLWKSETEPSGSGELLFLVDGKPKLGFDGLNWTQQSYELTKDKTYQIEWRYIQKNRKLVKGIGWIDDVCIRSPNYSDEFCGKNVIPNINHLISDKLSPQEAGNVINWTANASDLENDPLLYKFFLNGPATNDQLIEKTTWTSKSTWTWTTVPQDAGKNRVEVRIRDGKHAGPEGFDDREIIEFTIKPKMVQLVFKVNTVNELRDAINNSSHLEKLILLSGGPFKGNFYIHEKNDIIIEPDSESKGDIVMNGSNYSYIFAIEDSSNISIKALKILNGHNGILIEDSKDCTINNTTVKNFQAYGISLNNTSFTNITYNHIESLNSSFNISGINLTISRNNTINNNAIVVNHINDRIHWSILSNKSRNNTISFRGNGSIVEDTMQCTVNCLGGMLYYGDDDHTVANCRCQELINRKYNYWSFHC